MKGLKIITIYARKERTNDPILLEVKPNSKTRDTVFYEDEACTKEKARFPWYHSKRPISRKKVTINGFQYNVKWLN